MLLDVLLHLIVRQVRRIKSSPRRNSLRTHKRFIFVNQVEARGVDPKIASQLHIAPVPTRGQRLVERQSLGIALPPVDTFQVAAGLYQVANQLLLATVQTRRPERHLDATELGQALRSEEHTSELQS